MTNISASGKKNSIFTQLGGNVLLAATLTFLLLCSKSQTFVRVHLIIQYQFMCF